ncbi:MAG: hypothetical protein K2P17_05705 [Helicobacteraceae bacterium]|nr:hypothetical protein [Helicobacteraceae bacterium]
MQFVRKNQFIFFLAFIFLLFLVLNILAPSQNDDWMWERTLEDGIISSNIAFKSFMNWNARIGELIYISLIINLNPYIADLLNSIMDTIFTLLVFIALFARIPQDKFDFIFLLFIVLNLMVFMNFEEVFLWMPGSINYLWALSFVLIALLPYRFYYQYFLDSKAQKLDYQNSNLTFIKSNKFGFYPTPQVKFKKLLDFKIFILFFCVINMIAGMGNETFSVVVIALHILLLIYFVFYKKFKIRLWYYLGIISFVVGFLILYFSPGQSIRAGIEESQNLREFIPMSKFFAMSLSDKFGRLFESLEISSYRTPPIFLLFLFTLMYYELFIKTKVIKNRILNFSLYGIALVCWTIFVLESSTLAFIIIFGLSIYTYMKTKDDFNLVISFILVLWFIASISTFQVSNLPSRAYSIHNILLISIVLIVFYSKLKSQTTMIVMFCASMIYFSYVVYSYYDFRIKFNDFVSFINEAKAKNNEVETYFNSQLKREYQGSNIDIIYPKEKFSFRYGGFSTWWNLSNDKDYNLNQAYAYYFKVKSVRLE